MSVIRLPRLISNGVIFQRNKPIRVWGFPENAVKNVEVSLNGNRVSAVINNDEYGEPRFDAVFPEMPAGGPYILEFFADSVKCETVDDVYIGDVIQLAGQSNIEFPMRRVLESYPEELVNPDYPLIRTFKIIENRVFDGPIKDNTTGEWVKVTQESLPEYSAIGYFLAKKLLKDEGIAVGLINTTMGGAPIETFMSEEMISDYEEEYKELIRCRDKSYIEEIIKRDEKSSSDWYSKLDGGDEGLKASWYDPETDVSDWKTMRVPSYIEETEGLEGFCGSIWLKNTFDATAEMVEKQQYLWLGTMIDADVTYVNGNEVGRTEYCYPPRRYIIPAGLLKEGKNDITIRLKIEKGSGRTAYGKLFAVFSGDRLKIRRTTDGFFEGVEGAENMVKLDGIWKYRVGMVMPKREDVTFLSWKPTALFNGMVYPCTNFAVKAVLWYQGESNAERSEVYLDRFTRLVNGYRKLWKDDKLPVIYIQLPEYMDKCYEPDADHKDGKILEIDWITMQEVQKQCLTIPGTYMISAMGTGEYNDLHPQRKKILGEKVAEVIKTLQ